MRALGYPTGSKLRASTQPTQVSYLISPTYLHPFNHSKLLEFTMSKVGVLVKFSAKFGLRDQLVEHFHSLVGTTNTESGTEDWSFHLSPVEPDAVWLYEVYKDQAAMDAHNNADITIQAKAKTHELTAGVPEVVPLMPIAGKGLS
jgi:quinol monooxygenase YgiN